jgi:hypothetical protein
MSATQFSRSLQVENTLKSRFQYSDADYFNLSEKDTRIAAAQREKPAPALQQIRRVIQTGVPGFSCTS